MSTSIKTAVDLLTAPPATCTGWPKPRSRERSRRGPRPGCARCVDSRQRSRSTATMRGERISRPPPRCPPQWWTIWSGPMWWSSVPRPVSATSRRSSSSSWISPVRPGPRASWRTRCTPPSPRARTRHGGQESTLLSFYTTLYHWGGIVVPPGFTDAIQFRAGNPYGASHVSGDGALPDETTLEAASYQARRAVEVAAALQTGRAVAARGAPSAAPARLEQEQAA